MNAQVTEVIRNTELVVVETALAEMNKVTVGLADLTKRYKGVVFEVTDKKGMAEAKAARKEIAAPRIALEKIRERAKAPILELGRKVDAEAKRIKEQLEALEKPIDQQIAAEEKRIEDERLALVEAEQARVDGIQKRIADMQVSVHTAAQARTAAEVEKLMAAIDGTVIDESFAEYQDTAADVHNQVYQQLKATHASFVARETEAARLATERADFDKRRAEQEAADRERAQREEAARASQRAIDRALDGLRGDPNLTAMSGAEAISKEVNRVNAIDITAAVFGDRVSEALATRGQTVMRLGNLYAAAIEYANEQARQQQERERQADEQRRIDGERTKREAEEAERTALASMRMEEIMSMGHQVMIATGGRLGVRVGGTRECIVETLAETQGWTVTEEKFGSLLTVAESAKKAALTQITELLRAWDERVARETRERLEVDAAAAATRAATEQRLSDYRPNIDEILGVLVDHYQRDRATVLGWLHEYGLEVPF